MAMSDCVVCWETPCSCGHEYRAWSQDRKLRMVAAVLGLKQEIVDALLLNAARWVVVRNQPSLLGDLRNGSPSPDECDAIIDEAIELIASLPKK